MRQPQQNTLSKLLTVLFVCLVLPTSIFLVQYTRRAQGAASFRSYTIYEDALAAGWENRSWISHVNLANPSPVYSGTRSIAFTPTQIWAGLYLYTATAVDITPYTFLHFAARASRPGQAYYVMLYNAANHEMPRVNLAHYGGNPVPGTWKVYNIPLADLRAGATHVRGVALQSHTRRRGTLYLDAISFTTSASSLTAVPAAAATVDPPAAATAVPAAAATVDPVASATVIADPTASATAIADPTANATAIADPTTTGNTYYVSKNGSNADGKSWQTAWNELNQINWSVIQPGDTILLDGGSTTMTYTTTLTIGKNGTQNAPIIIEKSIEGGRNGKVIIFGGRSTPLPYCGQSNYTYQPASVNNGIVFGANSWIVIDGMNWHGISIYGFNNHGIDMTGSPSNDTVRNLEIYDIGTASQSSGAWSPDTGGHGIYLTGSNLTFERMDIHDVADDAFDTGEQRGPIHNITINTSWLHVSRESLLQQGLPFDNCTHQDGYQIYDGGPQQEPLIIENSVVGPGLGDAIILGATCYPQGAPCVRAGVNNVTIKNSLFMNKEVDIMGYPQVQETGWVLDHDTVVTPGNNQSPLNQALFLQGPNNTVTNSIFYEGNIYLPDGLVRVTGNCQWKTVGGGALGGQTVDPQFVTDISTYNYNTPLMTLQNADYTLRSTSPCAGSGSSITSVAQFLRMVNS